MSSKHFFRIASKVMAAFLVLSFILFVGVEINFTRKQPLIFMLSDVNDNPLRAWIVENGIYQFRGGKEEIDKLNHAEMREMETARQVVLESVLIKDKIVAKKMLEFFLSRGLDINAKNGLLDDGGALLDAVGSMDDKAVELLLTHGANPNMMSSTGNLKGFTVLQVARNFQDKFPDRDYSKIIKLLETVPKT